MSSRDGYRRDHEENKMAALQKTLLESGKEIADLRTRLKEAEKERDIWVDASTRAEERIARAEAENALLREKQERYDEMWIAKDEIIRTLKQTIEKVRKHCEFVSSDKRYFDSDRSFAHYILKILDGENK